MTFAMYRVKTEIELMVVSAEGRPVSGARVTPVWPHAGEPALPAVHVITPASGIVRLCLDLSFCRGESLLSSLFRRDPPHYAYVRYDLLIEHPHFASRVLSFRDGLGSSLDSRQVPAGLDAKLVVGPVELQPRRAAVPSSEVRRGPRPSTG